MARPASASKVNVDERGQVLHDHTRPHDHEAVTISVAIAGTFVDAVYGRSSLAPSASPSGDAKRPLVSQWET